MKASSLLLEKKPRRFLSETFTVEKWEDVKPFYELLLQRPIQSVEDLRTWFLDRSELESVLAEDMGWRYIRMTTDTTSEVFLKRFDYFISQIEPHMAPYTNALNKKAVENPFLKALEAYDGYSILIRSIEKELAIFREENIPLNTEIQQLSQKYGAVFGNMTVEVDGSELTLPQARALLQSQDRHLREEVFGKAAARQLQDREELDELFSSLVSLRNQVAHQAGFSNFRDYMFASLGRFDYSPQDCFDFHKAVKDEVVPVLNELARARKQTLKLEALKPWDLAVDVSGKAPLKPFLSSSDLVHKTILCFNRLDEYLGSCLSMMQEMGHLDLDSRKGKAPGGYNYPLAETGVPFIFMNATSTLRDMVTLLHEGGHAVHSFLTMDLELNNFKDAPSEIAELASMSMELLTMDHWDLFFEDEADLRRAKKEHLEQILETLPWVATIDKFQHWVYENPEHTEEARSKAWIRIFEDFSDEITDWTGLEQAKAFYWHKQLHLFEVPFYYIEYGIAQLGAIAVWKNYKEDPVKALQQYIQALKLGYTKSIPEVYKAAGIDFNFSSKYIRELIHFTKAEMEKL